MKSLKIIFHYASLLFQQTLMNLPLFFIFLLSKIVRYSLFALFLFFLITGVSSVSGYTRDQMLLFYLFFNIVDTSAQLLFREVYRFRPLVVSGGFDMILAKPFNPLLRALFGGPDFIDMAMLIVLLFVSGYFITTVIHPNLLSLFIAVLLVINSLIIAAAFHIFVLSFGIITLSVDHLIMIYRDLTSLMRIPVDVFTPSVRALLTFVIPVGIMFTFPAKALFSLLSWQLVTASFLVGALSLLLSLKFWHFALKRYSSASS